ncbi:actin-related protein 2/3 complex subunit 1B isoform X1 [Pyrus x bretschneideri]|uniref:actin-related protein 2/3 complex subunit 1B isoform X1 n=1 Tax=Pyrus x bretschneideri TaxID=225117 RepID=UPI00202F05D5|nr:actin-related protein 2/3 complex subunit 1B isoform X1 [Pyrus x bretschneideri]
MAAVEVHKFAQCITCHAWSRDRSMIAFCPNNNEVHIYALLQGKWEKLHVLQKHDQIVSGIDWSARANKIVTASHDRNSYVWNLEGSEWVPTLVILRLNRAALCVKWNPRENKFAVGSGAKTVCICYYEQENNWWVSKLIRKRHDSSVTSVAWHPNNATLFSMIVINKYCGPVLVSLGHLCAPGVALHLPKILLATASTDGKCRIFSTFIKVVDAKESRTGPFADSKFGEQILQLDLSFSWSFGVRWSPSGNTLAYVGHSSMIYFVDDVGPSPLAQNVAFRDLPLRDVLFLSERLLIGVGFDCNPMVFAADLHGIWHFIKFLGERKTTSSGPRYGSQFSEAFGKLYGQQKHGLNNDANEHSRSRGGVHENCINCIVPLGEPGSSKVTRFSTSGLDGKVVVWDMENQADLSEYL